LQILYRFLTFLTFRGYLTEKFNWRYHYYFLSDEGVEFLRDYLHLDADASPDTHTARTAKDAAEGEEAEKPERAPRGKWGDRE
jgi:small subunit ribosomal protein S10e